MYSFIHTYINTYVYIYICKNMYICTFHCYLKGLAVNWAPLVTHGRLGDLIGECLKLLPGKLIQLSQSMYIYIYFFCLFVCLFFICILASACHLAHSWVLWRMCDHLVLRAARREGCIVPHFGLTPCKSMATARDIQPRQWGAERQYPEKPGSPE